MAIRVPNGNRIKRLEREESMSQGKVLGGTAAAGATVASLPVTGASITPTVLVAAALVVGGLLLVRAARIRRSEG